jgi:hypothetical protein
MVALKKLAALPTPFLITRDKDYLLKSAAPFVLLVFLLLCSQTLMADGRIGLVKTYGPDVYVIRQGIQNNLQIGAEIFQGDTIVTKSSGAVGIIFSDGSVLTLGPSGKIIIEDFLLNPSEQKVSFVSQVINGSVAFVSGAIGRISPEAVQFKTPTATLGLRGTKILIQVK